MLDVVDTYFCERAAAKAMKTAKKEIERGELIPFEDIKRELKKRASSFLNAEKHTRHKLGDFVYKKSKETTL